MKGLIIVIALGVGAAVTVTMWLSGAGDETEKTPADTLVEVTNKAKGLGLSLTQHPRGGKFQQFDATTDRATCERLVDAVKGIRDGTECFTVGCVVDGREATRVTWYEGSWWVDRGYFPNCGKKRN